MSDWIHPEWPAPANVVSFFTTRGSGSSVGVYASLNLASHVSDDSRNVRSNRRKVSAGMPGEPVWLHQVHSNRVVRVDAGTLPKNTTADAGYCEIRHRVLAILVADCLPVLLCSKDGQAIAAIHAGWRGLATGLIERTLEVARQGEWIAWLGPAIGPCHYEVSDNVRSRFEHSQGFTPSPRPGRWYMDLYEMAAKQLRTAGVRQIYGGGYCTFCDNRNRFFSYRRDGETGRMGAFIWIT